MIKRIVGRLFFLAIIIGLALLYHAGYFTSFVIQEQEMGPYTLVYQSYTGDYNTVGPIITSLSDSLIDDAQILTTKSFGIYYDDPKITPKEQLKSEVGVVVDDQYMSALFRLGKKYSTKIWPKQKAFVVEYPYRSQLSVFVGRMKVYPAFHEYISGYNLSLREIMELYDTTTHKIFYIMPIK